MHTYSPSKQEIEAVMKELGFDYIQARNHLLCRHQLRTMK